MLINIAIEQMLADSEPELGSGFQIMGVIRILLDPENMITGKTDFLNFFYKHSIQTLIGESRKIIFFFFVISNDVSFPPILFLSLNMNRYCMMS